jgi:hypothetical protein
MKKVAVFGNTGGGKSTLARRLAELTRLPLYPLDLIQFKAGGGPVPREEYLKAHADILRRDAWIIDGFGKFAPLAYREHGMAACAACAAHAFAMRPTSQGACRRSAQFR